LSKRLPCVPGTLFSVSRLPVQLKNVAIVHRTIGFKGAENPHPVTVANAVITEHPRESRHQLISRWSDQIFGLGSWAPVSSTFKPEVGCTRFVGTRRRHGNHMESQGFKMT